MDALRQGITCVEAEETGTVTLAIRWVLSSTSAKDSEAALCTLKTLRLATHVLAPLNIWR